MGLKALKDKARQLGVKARIGMKREDLIRAIQSNEGNFPCFGTVKDFCDQMSCCWRENCLPVSK